MALGRLQPSVSQQLRRLTQTRIVYKVINMVVDIDTFSRISLWLSVSSFTSEHSPWRGCVWLRSSLVRSLRKHWLCSYSFVVYSPFASANKGACTANITGMQGVGKAFEYSDHGHYWWHRPTGWHHAVIPTSAPTCGNPWSCPWPSQQGGLQSSGVRHAGHGWGQSRSLYCSKFGS
jgi:hypothetical protein